MQYWSGVFFLLLISALFVCPLRLRAADSPETVAVRVALPADVLKDYTNFLAGRDPLVIKAFNNAHARRDVVEVVLVQQALALGGMPIKPKFLDVNSYARIQVQLKQGNILLACTSMWHCDLSQWQQDIYISEALIRNGEFEAGIYAHEKRSDVLAVKNLVELQQFKAISNEAWTVDWQTLKRLQLKSLESTAQWTSMIKMLGARRADFTLAPFQKSDDLSFVAEGMTFVPIPKVKIALSGSRHIAIAKNHARADAYFAALNKGIALLRAEGRIKRAYTESGFFNQRVADWTLINQQR